MNVEKTKIVLLAIALLSCIHQSKSNEENQLRVQPFSFPSTTTIGQRVSTMCATVKGDGKMDFQWLKNGQAIPKSSRIHIVSFPEFSNFIIDPLSEEDNGNYSCSVSSRGRVDSYTTSLNVLVPPYWKQKPVDVEAVSGEFVVLHCIGDGKPQPTSKWYKITNFNKDGSPIETSGNVVVHSNGTLSLVTTQKTHEGYYQCVVSNGVGTDLKQNVNIKVIGELKSRRYKMTVHLVELGYTAQTHFG